MTSGQFHLADINSIQVNRDERQRRELADVNVLADSIRRLGLIHPLVVTREMQLVAGERRLAACKSLGWMQISIQYTDEIEASQLEAIELEENIKRLDISWQDQVNAVQKYHALRKAQEASWSQAATAEAIGISQPRINAMLAVADEIAAGNERVVTAPKLSTAEGIVRRAQERKEALLMEELRGPPPKEEAEPESILNTDFNTWVATYSGPKFNFVHCDFPYGIDADKFNQGGAPSHGAYGDSYEVWEALIESLHFCFQKHVTFSCHLMFWFAMRKESERLYEPTVLALERMGLDVNPLPLIWMKSDGVGIIPDPERGPRQIYETCLFASRGDRKIVSPVGNAYHAPTVRDKHMSEKPEPVLRHFFRMFVDENTMLLDPTCGSGSALRAAESLGARHVLGLELNPEFAGLAREALKRARALQKASEMMSVQAI